VIVLLAGGGVGRALEDVDVVDGADVVGEQRFFSSVARKPLEARRALEVERLLVGDDRHVATVRERRDARGARELLDRWSVSRRARGRPARKALLSLDSEPVGSPG
jgi:hypothetical protein